MHHSIATLAFALTITGCGGSVAQTVHPGLANTPPLGGARHVEMRTHDAVANGDDSCGPTLEPGPLRYRYPPCPNVERASDALLLASRPPGAKGLWSKQRAEPDEHELRFWVPRSESLWSCIEIPKASLATRATFVPVVAKRPSAIACGPLDDGE
jgi:hypothetical protein